jgi:hypothetical protein
MWFLNRPLVKRIGFRWRRGGRALGLAAAVGFRLEQGRPRQLLDSQVIRGRERAYEDARPLYRRCARRGRTVETAALGIGSDTAAAIKTEV